MRKSKRILGHCRKNFSISGRRSSWKRPAVCRKRHRHPRKRRDGGSKVYAMLLKKIKSRHFSTWWSCFLKVLLVFRREGGALHRPGAVLLRTLSTDFVSPNDGQSQGRDMSIPWRWASKVYLIELLYLARRSLASGRRQGLGHDWETRALVF